MIDDTRAKGSPDDKRLPKDGSRSFNFQISIKQLKSKKVVMNILLIL